MPASHRTIVDAGLVPVLITEITGPEDKEDDKERPATPTNATVHPVDPVCPSCLLIDHRPSKVAEHVIHAPRQVIRMSPPQHLSGDEDGEDDFERLPTIDPVRRRPPVHPALTRLSCCCHPIYLHGYPVHDACVSLAVP